MMKNKILISGGFGFVGSNLIRFLNAKGITPYVYDTAALTSEQWKNVAGLSFNLIADPFDYYDIIVHLGANSSTKSLMSPELFKNNFEFSKNLFPSSFKTKFIYASSASTYGAEEKDFVERVDGLKPLNAYGFLKLHFDKWISSKINGHRNKNVIGLRFFNVYGPGEGFKGDMASVVHKALNKIQPLYGKKNEFWNSPILPTWNLFKSHHKGTKNGEQMRDFVYVEDICKAIWHFIENDCESGIYNLGSGKARSFNDLVKVVDPTIPIEYVEMPAQLKTHYQYFTEANLTKLREVAGYKDEFTSLEDGIKKTREILGL